MKMFRLLSSSRPPISWNVVHATILLALSFRKINVTTACHIRTRHCGEGRISPGKTGEPRALGEGGDARAPAGFECMPDLSAHAERFRVQGNLCIRTPPVKPIIEMLCAYRPNSCMLSPVRMTQ